MKRAVSCLDPEPTFGCDLSPKRRKPSPSDSGSCCLHLNHTTRPLQTLPLTPETLQALFTQSSALEDSTQHIEQWASHCSSCSEPEMAPPPTPSITSNDSSQRRASKKGYRRQRSQSPIKKSSTQYRSRNMADANVFVDHFPDPPSDVEDQLKHMFGVTLLVDIGQASMNDDLPGTSAVRSTVAELEEKYCHKSRQMAKDCAGEGEWKSSLLTELVKPLQEVWPDTLKLSASEKPWISELRPVPPSFEDILDAGSLPPPPPLPAQVLPQTPVFSTPSNFPSDATTDDPNHISIPKPDIALGLAHASFVRLQGKMLWDLQDNNRVLSEPHQSGIGLHFPFLIMEAKGLATGSNMAGAQNQAAVDGACALNILHDLKLTATTHTSRTSADQPKARQILFSVVTEGPIHELWVHYQMGEEYHMTLLRIWRTTIAKEASEFVRAMAGILRWGVGIFRADVLRELTAIETILRGRRIE